MLYVNHLLGLRFCQSVLPELDTYTIKELLRVKFGFMFLPFFDAEQVDCLLADLCTGYSFYFSFLLFYLLYFMYEFIININIYNIPSLRSGLAS